MPDGFELTDQPPTRHDSNQESLHRPTASLAMSIHPQAEAPCHPSIDTDDSAFEKTLDHRTVLKLDLILLPFVSLLFLLNSLDRSNVGNAETANFTKDAGLEPEDLNTAVACFFAFFVILQPVGAAVGRRYGMARMVPFCMALWGVCTAAHVLVRQKWQLITLRILLGILEGKRLVCDSLPGPLLVVSETTSLVPRFSIACAYIVPGCFVTFPQDNETLL